MITVELTSAFEHDTQTSEKIPGDYCCSKNRARAENLDLMGVVVYRALDVLSKRRESFYYYPEWIEKLLGLLLTIKANDPYGVVREAFTNESYRDMLDATARLGGSAAVAVLIERGDRPRPPLAPEEASRTVAEVDAGRHRPKAPRRVGGAR